MIKEEILEYNKRCAEFLGYKECLVNITDNYGYKVVVEGYITPFPKLNFDGTIYQYDVDSLLFHSDWNWIMEIVEAIEKLEFIGKVSIQYYTLFSGMGCYKIQIGRDSEDNKHPDSFPIEVAEFVSSDSNNIKKEAVVQAINQFLIWYDTRIS